jgi:phosphoribosyl 1,2-cyclic phosphate phosphodiesterase
MGNKLGGKPMGDKQRYLLLTGTGCGDYYLLPQPKTGEKETTQSNETGPNLRKPTQLFISPRYLVDFSTEGLEQLQRHNVGLEKADHILITHSQLDHFYGQSIVNYCVQRAQNNHLPTHIFGNEMIRHLMDQEILLQRAQDMVVVQVLEPFEAYHLGDMVVVPLVANHLNKGRNALLGETAFNYVFKLGSKTILYAVDTAYPLPETWAALSQHCFDIVIIEATLGEEHDVDRMATDHLNYALVEEIITRLQSAGNLAPDTLIALTHLSPWRVPSHAETAAHLARKGLILAFDGMRIDL